MTYTPFKMKGSAFYGKGNKSPLTAVNQNIIKAQAELDAVELGVKPAWIKNEDKIKNPTKDQKNV